MGRQLPALSPSRDCLSCREQGSRSCPFLGFPHSRTDVGHEGHLRPNSEGPSAAELTIALAKAVLGPNPRSSSPPVRASLLPQVLIPREQLNKILHTKAKSKTKIENSTDLPYYFKLKKKIYIYVYFLRGPCTHVLNPACLSHLMSLRSFLATVSKISTSYNHSFFSPYHLSLSIILHIYLR